MLLILLSYTMGVKQLIKRMLGKAGYTLSTRATTRANWQDGVAQSLRSEILSLPTGEG